MITNYTEEYIEKMKSLEFEIDTIIDPSEGFMKKYLKDNKNKIEKILVIKNTKKIKCKNKHCDTLFEPHRGNQKYCKPDCNKFKKCRCGKVISVKSKKCWECFAQNKGGRLSYSKNN